MTAVSDGKVVDFPNAEDRARRLKAEVERLARQSPTEWLFWLDDSAMKHGIAPAKLKTMIEATIKATEKQARQGQADQRQREQRAERQRAAADRKEERQQREQRRAQQQADKEAEKKQREREKGFAAILKLPSADHELRLKALAEQLGEDLDFIREEFSKLVAVEQKSSADTGFVEPWPEPVDLNVLLTETLAQVRHYAVIHDDAAAVAVVLWIAFAWVRSRSNQQAADRGVARRL
jgi:Skp family chaperone for outer membrane proteins